MCFERKTEHLYQHFFFFNFQGQNGWRVLQTGRQGEGVLQCETQTCDWNSTSSHLSVLSVLFLCVLALFLTNTLQGVEATTLLAPAVTYPRRMPVQPAVNNSDPFFLSLFHRKQSWVRRSEAENGKIIIAKLVAQPLFVQSDNDSSVTFTAFICFQCLFSIDFRPVCILWVGSKWILYCFKRGMKYYVLSHPLIALLHNWVKYCHEKTNMSWGDWTQLSHLPGNARQSLTCVATLQYIRTLSVFKKPYVAYFVVLTQVWFTRKAWTLLLLYISPNSDKHRLL